MNGTAERIRTHINTLMQNAPRTKAIDELREELYSGCAEKYNDLLAAGCNEEQAYAEVVAGIGDVDELVTAITQAKAFNPALFQENRRKRALYVCAGIAMIVGGIVVAVILTELFHLATLSGLVMLASVSAAVVLIVYGVMTTPYKYEKQEDTIVEDLKINMSQGGKNQRLFGAASSTLWTMTVTIYLFISFLTHAWHITWLLFMMASVAQTLMKAYFSPAGHRSGAMWGAFWTTVTLLYFLTSFLTHAWHITWTVFIAAAAIQQVFRLLSIWRE